MATTGAVWWLAAALALCACGAARGDMVTWPGCDTTNTTRVVEPGQPDANVTGLRLYQCNFTTMTLDSLKSYPNIKSFISTVGKLENFTAHTFHYFTELEVFRVTYGTVTGRNLPANVFHKCPRLRDIVFWVNDMTDTPADLLQGLDRLNTLACADCSLRTMPLFITQPVLHNMDLMQITGNSISRLENPRTFANVVNLTTLYLTNNRIEYIHEDLLKPLIKLQAIILDLNKLTHIPEGFFQDRTSLQIIYLHNNLIESVPQNAFMGTNLKALRLDGNRLVYLEDNFFSNLKSLGVNLIEFYFFGNPWNCAFLNELLIKVKKENITYDIDRFDGRHPACIFIPSLRRQSLD